MKTLKTIRTEAEAVLGTGIKNKENLFAALPVMCELQSALTAANMVARCCRKVLDELNEKCSGYALVHQSVFDEGLTEIRDNVLGGDITIDDVTYHFTTSPGEVRRIDGNNLTQSFIKALPEEMRKSIFKLDAGKCTDEELEKLGLAHDVKNTWSIKE